MRGIIGLLLAGLLAIPVVAIAGYHLGYPERPHYEIWHQYSAKSVCSYTPTFPDNLLAEGVYRSAINVHNPTEETVELRFKAAQGGATNDEPGTRLISEFGTAVLGPDEALEIDCGTIAGLFCGNPCIDLAWFKGFVVLQSRKELDVVGVYTARPLEGQVSSIDVQPVAGRTLRHFIR